MLRWLAGRITSTWERFRSLNEPPSVVGRPPLAPCPPAPNCVSSQSNDPVHRVDPLRWADSRERAIAAAARAVEAHPRASVERRTVGYLYAVFRIPVFGFVDDLEVMWDETDGALHVRSASRVGRYDLGVNRRRVEWLRKQLCRERPPARPENDARRTHK